MDKLEELIQKTTGEILDILSAPEDLYKSKYKKITDLLYTFRVYIIADTMKEDKWKSRKK
jgi:hypothetical protein